MVDLRRHRLALECALLAVLAYLAAVGVSELIRGSAADVPPAPPEATAATPNEPEPLAAYDMIAERDVFTPGGATPATRDGGTLRLGGVALHDGEARAVIEDAATHRQELYRVGDTVAGARVAAIDWDRVTLSRNGREETLELPPPGTHTDAPPAIDDASDAPAPTPVAADGRIRRMGENAWLVDRRELAGAVDNMSGLMTQLRAVAEVRDGRPSGFRLFEIRDGSLFARLGLRDGDVVRRVNGSPISEPAALLGFLQRLESEPRVALDIIRADAPRTLVYDLR